MKKQTIEVDDLIKALRMNNENKMLNFLSTKIGIVYWCKNCRQTKQEVINSFYGEKRCLQCRTIVEECTLIDFI